MARISIATAHYTLPETNGSHLKMDDWKTSFLSGRPIFRGYVREGMFKFVKRHLKT